jgi:mRNA-degrading endonuclease YafQ of YafQ-DinJ toxin-antitoxin module
MNEPYFDKKRFLLFVKDQAKIIKEQSFDRNQIVTILDHLMREWKAYTKFMDNKQISDPNLMHEAVSDVLLALQISFSNYRKENKNMWATIFGFGASKLPKLDPSILIK